MRVELAICSSVLILLAGCTTTQTGGDHNKSDPVSVGDFAGIKLGKPVPVGFKRIGDQGLYSNYSNSDYRSYDIAIVRCLKEKKVQVVDGILLAHENLGSKGNEVYKSILHKMITKFSSQPTGGFGFNRSINKAVHEWKFENAGRNQVHLASLIFVDNAAYISAETREMILAREEEKNSPLREEL